MGDAAERRRPDEPHAARPLNTPIQPNPANNATRSSSPLGVPGTTPAASSSTSPVAAANSTATTPASSSAGRRGPSRATAPIPATASVTEII
ncbi:hypothetical protein Q0Z83_035090 [Actinoplanes sichuanensis]|nr:hypothetical protein Q0Z83_035090 [Actinoplanes sichuanensis]